jgi:hypothetical protein
MPRENEGGRKLEDHVRNWGIYGGLEGSEDVEVS